MSYINDNNDNNFVGQTARDTSRHSMDERNRNTWRDAGDEQQRYKLASDVTMNPEQHRTTYGNTDIPGNTTNDSTYGAGEDFAYGGARSDDYDPDKFSHQRLDDSGGEFGSDEDRQRKPGLGDSIRGNVDNTAGKFSRNPELQERGQERKTGQF